MGCRGGGFAVNILHCKCEFAGAADVDAHRHLVSELIHLGAGVPPCLPHHSVWIRAQLRSPGLATILAQDERCPRMRTAYPWPRLGEVAVNLAVRHFKQERLPALPVVDYAFFRPALPVVGRTFDCKPVIATVRLDAIGGRCPERIHGNEFSAAEDKEFRAAVVAGHRSALAAGSIVVVFEQAAFVGPTKNVASDSIVSVHSVIVRT